LKKIGLCLSGGGGKGAYQAGAIKALSETHILSDIAVFSGTSIGAANAAVLVSKSAQALEEVWFSIPQHPLNNKKDLLTRLLEEKHHILDQGIYSMDTFSRILTQYIDETNLKKKRVYATVSNGGDAASNFLSLLKSSYDHFFRKQSQVVYVPLDELTHEEALKAVIASCSIPVVFPAVKQKQRKFYDGGVFDNVPVKPLVDAGCQEIITIQLSRGLFFHPEDYPHVKIHQIKHQGSLGGILNFNKDHINKIFTLGYLDAKAFLKTYSPI
jgi:NTE family protein